MPIGQQPGGVASGPSVGPRLVPYAAPDAPATGAPGAAPGPGDVWDHLVFAPAGVPGQRQAAGSFTKLVVVVRDAVAVYIGLGRVPTTGENGYDIVHPGNGLLEFVVPPNSSVGLAADGALTLPVDVYCLGGTYTLP